MSALKKNGIINTLSMYRVHRLARRSDPLFLFSPPRGVVEIPAVFKQAVVCKALKPPRACWAPPPL